MIYRLQQYSDDTFGYLGIDGDEYTKTSNGSRVICTQGEDEDRESFIRDNGITFSSNKQYGYNENLDRLVNDPDPETRMKVAKDGYAIDILQNDDFGYVVEATIPHIDDDQLNKLVNSKHRMVRAKVAKRGYGLKTLVHDEEWYVRMTVADQGYGLDLLVKDKDKYVRAGVKCYLEMNDLTLEQWKKLYPDKCAK